MSELGGPVTDAVVQRKVTNGYRAMVRRGKADVRTVVDTGRFTPGANTVSAILQTILA